MAISMERPANSQPKQLSHRARTCILHMALGDSQAKAAAKSGYSVRHVQRLIHSEAGRACFKEMNDKYMDELLQVIKALELRKLGLM